MKEVARIHWPRLTVVLALCAAACQPTIHNERARVMTEEVLHPIASQQAEDRISKARALLAQINLAKEQQAAGQAVKTAEPRVLFKGVLGLMEVDPEDARDTAALKSFADLTTKKSREVRKTEYQDVLAWLDRRREPLQNELTRRLVAKTVATEKGFLVCIEGVQRQYEQTEAGRFKRLPDKAGGC